MRKRGKAHFWVIMEFAIALVMLTVLVGILLVRRAEKQKAVEASAPVMYSQEEVDALLVRVKEETTDEIKQELLGEISKQLADGQTVVETLRPLYPNQLVVVSNGRFHFVPIRDDLKHNSYQKDEFTLLENGEWQYQNDGQIQSHKGVDVSKFQGRIDWTQVAGDGVEFAIIRVGLRGYGSGKLVEDEFFEQNIEGALRAGIKVGVYFYSQAITEEELLEEANFVLEKIAPYQIECPVVYDVERVVGADGRMNALSVEERTNLTLLFCRKIAEAGYRPMIYHNMEMSVLMLDLEQLEDYGKWFAYYNSDFYYPYAYDIWQYSEKGKVNGIDGDVDLNISFGPIWN
ncbi:MAG: glycoside hydrolase family 25 protein [Acetatifactor sp.]|nr:glycoside hydrolase family 25 protein [Acetatifactor sp.]